MQTKTMVESASNATTANDVVAVVIPCYSVKKHILSVLNQIGPEVRLIYCVDDACPQGSGEFVKKCVRDSRVRVISRLENGGVGAATITGYQQAISDGATIIVKLDGDGQMNPGLINRLIMPIATGGADYTKGNRFYNIESLVGMPKARLVGNAGLSFLSKLSTGYWNVYDPTNGFTAISAKVAKVIPLSKIDRRYFFESDLLFRLGTVRAVVRDIPMDAIYRDEKSNLKIREEFFRFSYGHAQNFLKRLFYCYLLRDFSLATVELFLGVPLLSYGILFSLIGWLTSFSRVNPVSAGLVMQGALPIIVGLQLVLAFLNFDVSNQPRIPVSESLQSI